MFIVDFHTLFEVRIARKRAIDGRRNPGYRYFHSAGSSRLFGTVGGKKVLRRFTTVSSLKGDQAFSSPGERSCPHNAKSSRISVICSNSIDTFPCLLFVRTVDRTSDNQFLSSRGKCVSIRRRRPGSRRCRRGERKGSDWDQRTARRRK